MSWIRGEEYVITPSVVASALGHLWYDSQSTFILRPLLLMTLCHISPVLPFNGVLILVSPPMSLQRFIICFFGFLVILFGPTLSCTPFLLSFPTLFIRSLVKVHKSSSIAYGLFFPVFIYRILLHLGLEDFLASKPVHIIAPIGATFLSQRAAQTRAIYKRPRVESSIGAAAQPPSLGDPTAEAYVNPTTTVDPSPSTLGDSTIQSMFDIVMTVQAAHDQLLVDVLTELQALRVDLASVRRSTPPPPFDDEP